MTKDASQPTDGHSATSEASTDSTGGRVDRRRLLKTVGAGALATTIAGCTSGGDGGDGGGGGNGSDGGGGGDGSSESISMGILCATDYQLGNSLWRGAKIAIDEINENGGIGGRQIEHTLKNTEADPQTGSSVYQELTTGQNVDVTVGTWSSEVLIATLNQISQSRTVHLSAGASTAEAPRQLKDDYENLKYWFRPGPINSVYMGQMAQNLADGLFPPNDLTKVALLGENYAWADSSWDSVLRNVPKAGVEIVQKTRYSADTEDFTTVFDRVESNGADVVLALAAYTATPLVNQWANQERSFGLTGVINSLQPSTAYQELNGTPQYAVPWVVATPESNNTERTAPFAEEYVSRHDMSPLYTGYCGYDAVYAYKNAVEEAGSIASDDLIDPLENLSMTGTQGQIEFGARDSQFPHDLKYSKTDTPQVHVQWQEEGGEGVQTAVYPEEFATGEYVHPDWI